MNDPQQRSAQDSWESSAEANATASAGSSCRTDELMREETPREARRLAADLLNQQAWCWGRDIESSTGNLLVRHGFERLPPLVGNSAASVYRLEVSPRQRLVLRGFGVFYGDDDLGGLFLHRFSFLPQLTPAADLSRPPWVLSDLPPLAMPLPEDAPRCRRLLLDMMDWIRQYEVWIVQHYGLEYRREVLAPLAEKHRQMVPAEDLAATWRRLGLVVADHPGHFIELAVHDRSVISPPSFWRTLMGRTAMLSLACLAGLATAGSFGCSPPSVAQNPPATEAEDHIDIHKHGDNTVPDHDDHPATLAAAVMTLDELRVAIKEAFAAGDMAKADEPVHEIGHVLEAIPLLAQQASLATDEQNSIKRSVGDLFDSYGKIDAKLHGGEGSTYADVATQIESAMATLRKYAKSPKE